MWLEERKEKTEGEEGAIGAEREEGAEGEEGAIGAEGEGAIGAEAEEGAKGAEGEEGGIALFLFTMIAVVVIISLWGFLSMLALELF